MGTRNSVFKTVTLLLFALLLIGCDSTTPEPVTVKETVIAEVPVTVEVTRVVKVTSEVADRSQPAASAMEATIPGSQVSMLPSSASDRVYRVFVALPLSYSAEPDATYPVVYVVDGSVFFNLVTTTARWLHLAGDMPEVIVVGIDNETGWADDIYEWLSFRFRDLTPTEMTAKPGSGGAGEFLAFIQQDLIPHIDANYRTDPADRTIAGHSLGGLFSLYALFHAPETFTRYIASSPALWWDDRVTFEHEQEFATQHADLPAELFLSVGELEAEHVVSGLVPEERWVANVEELHSTLEDRDYAALEMEMVILDDEHHVSGFPGAFSRGLRSVFR